MDRQDIDHAHWSSSTLAERIDSRERTYAIPRSGHKVNAVGHVGKPRINFSNVLEIRVGDEGFFLVPQNRMLHRSGFFKERCLQRSMDRQEVIVVELPHEDRFLFDIYLQIVYQDEVVLPLHVEEAGNPHWSIGVMVRAYMLAEKLKDKMSCNIIVDGLVDFCSNRGLVLVSEDWELIFHDNYQGLVLRKLAADFCVLVTQPDFLKTQLDRMPLELAINCVGRFSSDRHEMLTNGIRDPVTSLADLDRCKNYHQHDESFPPCKTPSPVASETETPASYSRSPAASESSSDSSTYNSANSNCGAEDGDYTDTGRVWRD
jgi:hypothetical protein